MKLSLKKELASRKEEKKENIGWIIKITLLSLIISFTFSFLSEGVIKNVDILVGILLLLVFIFIGILFDMIGVAITASDLSPFNSMSSRRIKSAKVAVKLKQNAEKVSSICNDVISDVCGIVSGSAGAIIAVAISQKFNTDITLTALLTTSVIASLTIGGKAIGKIIAFNKSNYIIYEFAKIISIFYKKK